MMDTLFSLVALFFTLLIHLISTVWWAASVTRRIDHIEKWITHHENISDRITSLEQNIKHMNGGVKRIENFLRQNSAP